MVCEASGDRSDLLERAPAESPLAHRRMPLPPTACSHEEAAGEGVAEAEGLDARPAEPVAEDGPGRDEGWVRERDRTRSRSAGSPRARR